MNIQLNSRKYPGLVATIDDLFAELAAFNYCPRPEGARFYAQRNLKRDGVWTTRELQRDVFDLAGIEIPAGFMVDHISGDSLDCRLDNLRRASAGQNGSNRRSAHGTSRYLGVSQYRNGKWKAQIKSAHKVTGLGYYASQVQAALAYDAAARVHHGEFARLNFPTIAEYVAGKRAYRHDL
jgi:hypothetical protein